MTRNMPVKILTVYVPEDYQEDFISSIQDHIPKLTPYYDRVCWWSTAGTEQFRPLKGANPEEGEIGQTIRKPSCRIEIVLPFHETSVQAFIEDHIIPAHPWNAPVFTLMDAEFPVPEQ